jgi:peptidylprolyl isomerase
MRRHRYLILPLLLVVFAVAACGGEDDRSDETAATPAAEAPAETPAEPATESPAPAAEGESGVKVTGSLKEKPTIEVPGGEPPAQLVIEDIKEGTGEEAKPGQTVNVQYVGALFKDGSQFDASWDRGEPLSFPLGQGAVIPGWDQGVAGMKVGGRRVLTIPPDLAYGPNGAPPAIGPNETLVFVVDLEEVSSP